MRTFSVVLAALLAGCGPENPAPPDASADAGLDASTTIDAALDASTIHDAGLDASAILDASTDGGLDASADAGCAPTVLLTGGSDVTAQGWTVVSMGAASVSYADDYVLLQTSTSPGGSTGGQLLLEYPGALASGEAFALEVVVQVDSVDSHNALDAAAAILGSFTAPFGTSAERAQMIYLDAGSIGWADDSESHAFTVADGAYHTYVLAVSGAGVATLSVDGTALLTRTDFATNGVIAIGDQTNEPSVDATMRIRSVRKLCL